MLTLTSPFLPKCASYENLNNAYRKGWQVLCCGDKKSLGKAIINARHAKTIEEKAYFSANVKVCNGTRNCLVRFTSFSNLSVRLSQWFKASLLAASPTGFWMPVIFGGMRYLAALMSVTANNRQMLPVGSKYCKAYRNLQFKGYEAAWSKPPLMMISVIMSMVIHDN